MPTKELAADLAATQPNTEAGKIANVLTTLTDQQLKDLEPFARESNAARRLSEAGNDLCRLIMTTPGLLKQLDPELADQLIVASLNLIRAGCLFEDKQVKNAYNTQPPLRPGEMDAMLKVIESSFRRSIRAD